MLSTNISQYRKVTKGLRNGTINTKALTVIDWSSVKMLETLMRIVTRVTGRVLVGQPLCEFLQHQSETILSPSLGRNPNWIKLNTIFAVDVLKTGMLLRLFPAFLRL